MAVQRNPCRYCANSYYDERTKHRVPALKPECSSCEWRKEHKQYLQSKRQFIPGEPITDLNTLSEQEWVLWYGHTKHIEVIKSMTLRTVLMLLKKGELIWQKLTTFQKQQKHKKNIVPKKVIRILHHITENVSVVNRISILKKDEQEAEKKRMGFLLREHQRN